MPISIYRNLTVLSFALLITGLMSCQSIVSDKKTDSITKLTIHYLNAGRADSIYQLTGEELRKHMSPAMLASFNKQKYPTLLPLNNVTFITKNDSVSVYKADAKIPLNFYIGLNKQNKISKFYFLPFQKEIKAVVMSTDEKRTDALVHKFLDLINRKQADSAYLLVSDKFKSHLNAAKWSDFADYISLLTPYTVPIFVRSDKGVNIYAFRNSRLAFGAIDKEGKFNVLGAYPYADGEVKAKKAATDNKLITHLDSVVNKVMAAYIQTKNNVGISAGVFYKGKSYFYNYGERKQGSNTLPDNHTVYEVGSITKTFTTTLLAIAVNEQKLTLETSITKFLPDSVAANPELERITFKELANHTSGFSRMPAGAELTVTDANQPFANYGTKEMFAFLKHFKQIRQPGVKYQYSNFAVGLLGVLFERIYHKPYPKLVREYITVPLNMTETIAFADTAKLKNLAQGYGELFEPVPLLNFTAIQSAGVIKSTTSDLITYARAQLFTADAKLNAGIKLTHLVTFNNGFSVVGLGWHYLPDDKNVLQHTGATAGYRSSVCIDLKKQIGIAVLTNNASTGDAVGVNLIKAIQAMGN